MKLDDLDNPADVTDDDRGERFTGQTRMAHRFAQSHRAELIHVHGRGWMRWDGTRWALDNGDVHATRRVLRVLYDTSVEAVREGDKQLAKDQQVCHSDRGIRGVLNIARTLPGMAFTLGEIDADPYLLNTATGTVDLRTMETRPHDPGDRISKITRAGVGTDPPGENWTRFLERVLPDVDVRAFLQRVVGLALLGKVQEAVLPILTGTGANGKGSFYGAVLHALGDYASTAEPNLFMHKENQHPAGEMDLAGKRLVVVSESDKGKRLAEATMKRLTGGDIIKARHMGKDWVEFAPSHTALLITNHLPQVAGDDPAIWRRLRIVPFDVVIPEEERDRRLEERLQLEADAILTWALAGYADFVELDGLRAPAAVRRATAAYQLDSDAVAKFIEERCYESSAAQVKFADLFGEFTKWCADEGAESVTKRGLATELDRRGFENQRRTNGAHWRTGIGLYAAEET